MTVSCYHNIGNITDSIFKLLNVLSVLDSLLALISEVIEGVLPKDLKHALEGLTVTSACRQGKQMWIEFGSMNPALLMHLGKIRAFAA
jgi:formamidopyrimidine-DNA glycosylase